MVCRISQVFCAARLAGIALIASVPFAGAVQAASPTIGSLSVTMTIEADCDIAAGSVLDFGTHGVLTADQPATTNLLITCTPGTSYSVGLDAGANESAPGDVDTRRMIFGASDYISYQLYKESGHTNVWGDAGGELVTGTGDGTEQSLPVFGNVPVPSTAPAAGTYSDTITVTITF